jgi:hypothetical protein
MSKIPKNITAVLTQCLNLDNLIAESPGVGDMLNKGHIAADFESTRLDKHGKPLNPPKKAEGPNSRVSSMILI